MTPISSSPVRRPKSQLEADIADGLDRIAANYAAEGAGPGSRFEGERLEVVQARWAIRQLFVAWDIEESP